jgi:Tol biopolymer transport system component
MTKRCSSFASLLAVLGLLLSGCGAATQTAVETKPPAAEGTTAPIEATKTTAADTPTQTPCSLIAFTLYNNDSGQIYTACPDGSELTALTSGAGSHIQPAWSPDGSRIAYASEKSGTSQVYVMNADGSGEKRLTTDLANDWPQWLPDGSKIAYRTTDGKGLWYWQELDLANGTVTRLNEPSYDFFYPKPAWSPDGRYEATMSLVEQAARNDGSSQIHLKDLTSGTDTALTDDTWANVSPVFSPDSQQIAFFSERDGTYEVYALYVMALDGSGLHRVSEPMFDGSAQASWSPDGKEIIVSSLYSPKGTLIYNVETGNYRVFLEGKVASNPAWGK